MNRIDNNESKGEKESSKSFENLFQLDDSLNSFYEWLTDEELKIFENFTWSNWEKITERLRILEDFNKSKKLMEEKEKDIVEIEENRDLLLDSWIYRIRLNEIDFVCWEVSSKIMQLLYHWDILRKIDANYWDILVWKAVYNLNEKKNSSDLLDIQTVNQHFQNDLLRMAKRDNIINWLWSKMLEMYFEDITNLWIDKSWLFSLNTAIWFYRKTIERLIDEWKVRSYSVRWQNIFIKTNNYYK